MRPVAISSIRNQQHLQGALHRAAPRTTPSRDADKHHHPIQQRVPTRPGPNITTSSGSVV